MTGKLSPRVKDMMGRHLFHLVAGSTPPLLALALDRAALLLLVGATAAAFVVGEALRLAIKPLNDRLALVLDQFGGIFKGKEASEPTGATYFLVAAFLALLLFPRDVAIAGLLYSSVGDMTAAVVGERFGSIKLHPALGSKSAQGSAAFLAVSLAIGFALVAVGLHLSPTTVVVGALVATLAELLPLRLDDNLTVPLLSSLAMAALAGQSL